MRLEIEDMIVGDLPPDERKYLETIGPVARIIAMQLKEHGHPPAVYLNMNLKKITKIHWNEGFGINSFCHHREHVISKHDDADDTVMTLGVLLLEGSIPEPATVKTKTGTVLRKIERLPNNRLYW